MELNQEELQVLKSAIREGVDSKLREASEKDLFNSILETTKEKLGGKECTLDIRGIITKEFDRIYDPEKYEKNKEKIETIYSILDEMK